MDLQRPDVYRRYLQTPELLIEEQKLGNHEFIVIDEKSPRQSFSSPMSE